MSLGPAHHGYYYQDVLTGIALVDLLLGNADVVTVDTKEFGTDRFDDVNITHPDGTRLRLQIKHTTQDRELAHETFSQDGRNLKLDQLLNSLLTDLGTHPNTTYRIVVRDTHPDADLCVVLKPVAPAIQLTDPLPGITTTKYQFDLDALRTNQPWTGLVSHLDDGALRLACDHLVVDTNAPASTIDFASPGPAERALMRRVKDELGVGSPPNTDVTPEAAAAALVLSGTFARVKETGVVRRELIEPRLGLRVDFGAVAEGNPVEPELSVARDGATSKVSDHIGETAPTGGRIVVVGEPGAGKSWLSEQLADKYRTADWVVARHHCWLGSDDTNRRQRVLSDVVIGSLLDQLGRIVPGSTKDLRPRYAASIEALGEAIDTCRELEPERNILLIIDGLDHVDRVVGLSTSQIKDPSQVLVEELAAVPLPPGVCMVIASQPGSHLDPASPAAEPLQMPPMIWDEVHSLAEKHGLLSSPDGAGPIDTNDANTIVTLIHERSNGNALYATYLCRLAMGTSPLGVDEPPLTVNELIHRLEQVPDGANSVEEYYGYLLNAMTQAQLFAAQTLALCDFALTPDELAEVLAAPAKALVLTALKTLAPILNTQPGVGGLRLHHESFARQILRDIDAESAEAGRQGIANWLEARGFFSDSRAFRHLPDLLASLGQYDQLKQLVDRDFVANGIRHFHSPAAVQRALSVVCREAEARLDWRTLITCLELRKAIDTYENEALEGPLIDYADVLVELIGGERVAERLLYDGRATFPARWGIRISDAVDRGGSAAPWKAYIDAFETQRKTETTRYTSDNDGTLHVAFQRGALRLREQRGDLDPTIIPKVAAHLDGDLPAPLSDLVEVFAAVLPIEYMPQIAEAMTDPSRAAAAHLTLADLAHDGVLGLPEPDELTRKAWALDPTIDIVRFLRHGITPEEICAGNGIADLGADLNAATDLVVRETYTDEPVVRRWLSFISLARAANPALPLSIVGKLSGPGFYRAWLRYTVATLGITDDVHSGTTTPVDASTAVLVALAELRAEATPFTGKPRATDLYSIHGHIHQVLEDSLCVVQPADLATAVDHLLEIGFGTTTSTNFGLADNGPLTANDFIAVLSRIAQDVGVESIHSALASIRERRNDDSSLYSAQAEFELEIARICLAAGALDEARECWDRAADLLACYGSHKDPTLAEVVDSITDIHDVTEARERLAKLVPLVYLVYQHTNGRDTSHYQAEWWEIAATIDPTAAAQGGADLYLKTIGFEDHRAETAQIQLLQGHASTADPVVLAALRLSIGPTWRSPETDVEVLTRLAAERGTSQPVDTMLEVLANTVAATYDNQPMQHTSDQSKAVVDAALIDAVINLAGPEFTPREAQPDNENSHRTSDTDIDRQAVIKRLIADQQPEAPEGRAGAIVIAQALNNRRYNDDPTPTWDTDTATTLIGYRILELSLAEGAIAGVALIDDVAREVSTFSGNDIFADLGQGLAEHAVQPGAPNDLRTVASYCLATAYQRIRGRGGWLQFAGREHQHLWVQAHDLDPDTAERVLAAAVTNRVNASSFGSYGSTQGLIAAFAARPANTPGGTPTDCWDAAYDIISSRLPGTPHVGDHTYQPTRAPGSANELDTALATLALSAVAQPIRQQIRVSLVAAAFLLTLRPTIGQAAVAYVLRAHLDSGRITWLLETIRTNIPAGRLEEGIARELTRLSESDLLSVRHLAGQLLTKHGRPVPNPPATKPAPEVTAAFHAAFGLDAEEDQ